jgi:hypothetical protein
MILVLLNTKTLHSFLEFWSKRGTRSCERISMLVQDMLASKVIQIRGSKKQRSALKVAAADLTGDIATGLTVRWKADCRRQSSLGSPKQSESVQ